MVATCSSVDAVGGVGFAREVLDDGVEGDFCGLKQDEIIYYFRQVSKPR